MWVQWLLGGGVLTFVLGLLGLIVKRPSDAAQALLTTTQSYSLQLSDLRTQIADLKTDRETDVAELAELRDARADDAAKIHGLERRLAAALAYIPVLLTWGRAGGRGPEPDAPADLYAADADLRP